MVDRATHSTTFGEGDVGPTGMNPQRDIPGSVPDAPQLAPEPFKRERRDNPPVVMPKHIWKRKKAA